MTDEHHFPIFERRPTDEYLSRWSDYISTTGYPERFEGVSRSKPANVGDDIRLLSGEMKVPILKREDQKLVPCPICHPDEPWFQNGHMAWFPTEKVVRFIGHDCAKKHYKERFGEAEERFRREGRVRYLIKRWHELVPHVDYLDRTLSSYGGVAKTLEKLRAAVDGAQKGRGLATFLHRELRKEGGRITIPIDTGSKDQRGNAIFDIDVLGQAKGAEFWGKPFVPFQELISLQAITADLRNPLPEWVSGDENENAEQEIVDRGSRVDYLPENIQGLHDKLTSAQSFFHNENLALLERWAKNVNSPFKSLTCRIENGRFVIASNSFEGYHYANPVIDGYLEEPLPTVSSALLELRRAVAKSKY